MFTQLQYDVEENEDENTDEETDLEEMFEEKEDASKTNSSKKEALIELQTYIYNYEIENIKIFFSRIINAKSLVKEYLQSNLFASKKSPLETVKYLREDKNEQQNRKKLDEIIKYLEDLAKEQSLLESNKNNSDITRKEENKLSILSIDNVLERYINWKNLKREKKENEQSRIESIKKRHYNKNFKAPFIIMPETSDQFKHCIQAEKEFRKRCNVSDDLDSEFFIIKHHSEGIGHWDTKHVKSSIKNESCDIESSGADLSCGAYTLINIIKSNEHFLDSRSVQAVEVLFDNKKLNKSTNVNNTPAMIVREFLSRAIEYGKTNGKLNSILENNIELSLKRINKLGVELTDQDIEYVCLALDLPLYQLKAFQTQETDLLQIRENTLDNLIKNRPRNTESNRNFEKENKKEIEELKEFCQENNLIFNRTHQIIRGEIEPNFFHLLICSQGEIFYIEPLSLSDKKTQGVENIIHLLNENKEEIKILYIQGEINDLSPKIREELLLILKCEHIYYYFNFFVKELFENEKILGCDTPNKSFLEKQKTFLKDNWEKLENSSFRFFVQKLSNNLENINYLIDDWSLLHYAVARNLSEVVNDLLMLGIKEDVKSIQIAIEHKSTSCIELLSDRHVKRLIKKMEFKDNIFNVYQKDEYGYPPIYYAVLSRKLDNLKKIFEFDKTGINLKIDDVDLLTISSRFWNIEIVEFILNNEFFSEKKCFLIDNKSSEEAKKFYDKQIEIRECIELNDLNKIISLIDKENFRLQWMYEDRKILADVAAASKKIEIYAYFLSIGSPLSSLEEWKWDKEEKQKLKNFIKKNDWHFDLKKVTSSLALKTAQYPKAIEKNERRKYEKLYEQLYGLGDEEEVNNLNKKYLKPILDILEEVSDLKICYDLERSSVEALDPFGTKTTAGICNISTHEILIGGKELDSNKNVILGTTIHEFTHLACQMVWENDANPYSDDEEDIKVNFQDILKEIKDKYDLKKDIDEIIGRVFSIYTGSREYQQASELIVRVPHVIAHYGKKGLEILKNQVPNLLTFYEKKFLPVCEGYLNPEFRFKRYCLKQSKIYSLFNKEKISVKNVSINLSDIVESYLYLISQEKFNPNKFKSPTLVYNKDDNSPLFFIDDKGRKTIPKEIKKDLRKIVINNKLSKKIFISKNDSTLEVLLGASSASNKLLSSNDILDIPESGKKILILGKAGMGKSALCKNIIYQFASDNERWKKRFKWAFYVPLRNLNEIRYPKKEAQYPGVEFNYAEKDIIFKECLPVNDLGLKNLIYDEEYNKDALWVLDGYHELQYPIPAQLEKVFKRLLDKENVIITSRHYGSAFNLNVARKLEIEGFKEDNIKEYVLSFFHNESDVADSLFKFLKDSEKEEIARVPINLELICNIWKSDREKITQQTLLTMTNLYKNILWWLMRRFLYEKGYKEADLKDENRIQRRLSEEIVSLGKVAFYLMENNQLILTSEEFKSIVPGIKEDKGLYADIIDIGLLAIMGSPAKPNYEFVHQSFQEYFAAHYIVRILQLSSDNEEYEKVINFIKSQKYSGFNQLLLTFVSGLVGVESEASKVFWGTIHSDPIGISGIKHISLLLSCLQETNCSYIFSTYLNVQEYISKHLINILKFSKNAGHSFPQNYLFSCLKKSNAVVSHRNIFKPVIDILSSVEFLHRPTILDFFVQHTQAKTKDFVISFLRGKILSFKKYLKKNLKKLNSNLFRYLAISLKNASDNTKWLFEILEGNKGKDKVIALFVIGEQKLNNDMIINSLINIASGGDDDFLRILIIITLKNIEDYRPEILAVLNEIIVKDGNSKIRKCAEECLNVLYDKKSYDKYWEDEKDVPDSDDYDDEYVGLTESERWLVEPDLSHIHFLPENSNIENNIHSKNFKQLAVTLKGRVEKVSKEKYNEFLIRKMNDELLDSFRIGLLSIFELNYLIKNDIYLLNTPLINLIRAYASLPDEEETKLLGRLIARRVFYHGITLTILAVGIVIYEEEKEVYLKANCDNETIWRNFSGNFSTLLVEEARAINFPIPNQNCFKLVSTIKYFPQKAIQDELFIETVQLKEIKKLNTEALNPESINQLSESNLKILLKNEQYLLKTSLRDLILAFLNLENSSISKVLGQLVAGRILHYGAIINEIAEGISIYDGNGILILKYDPSVTQIIKNILAIVYKFSKEIGSPLTSNIYEIYYKFMINISILHPLNNQPTLSWMKEIDARRKWEEWKEKYNKENPKAEKDGFGAGTMVIYLKQQNN